MMSIARLIATLVIAVTFLAAGCSDADDTDYPELAARLMQITRAVEAEVRYGDAASAELVDEALLQKALAEKPGWRQPFEGHALIARVLDGHAVVLVCSADKQRGLLEDSGCTPAFDNYLTGDVPVACAPTMTAENVCQQ